MVVQSRVFGIVFRFLLEDIVILIKAEGLIVCPLFPDRRILRLVAAASALACTVSAVVSIIYVGQECVQGLQRKSVLYSL